MVIGGWLMTPNLIPNGEKCGGKSFDKKIKTWLCKASLGSWKG